MKNLLSPILALEPGDLSAPSFASKPQKNYMPCIPEIQIRNAHLPFTKLLGGFNNSMHITCLDQRVSQKIWIKGSHFPFLSIDICKSLFWGCWGSHVLKWAGVTEMNPDAELSPPLTSKASLPAVDRNKQEVSPSRCDQRRQFPLAPLE